VASADRRAAPDPPRGRRGGAVHLAFTPTELALEGAPDQVLDAAGDSPWRVPANAGRVLLQFQSANGFSAYQASFVV